MISIMKKFYSTIMMLAMMVAALSFTACGGDSDDDEFDNIGNLSDDDEFFEITINGEKYISPSWFGGVLVGSPVKYVNGVKCTPYGGGSGYIHLDNNKRFMFFVIAGYAEGWESNDWTATIRPKSEGTYPVEIDHDQSNFDNIGMLISTNNADNYEVTTGSMRITKLSKLNKNFQYRTEGTFSFTFYDNVHNEKYVCSGKFKMVI